MASIEQPAELGRSGTEPDPHGQVDPHHERRWWILAILGIAQLMVILDSTVVNIALPSAQRALHFSNNDRQWIVTAYALAFGSLLPLGGRLSDLLGRKVMFLIGLVGFAGASAIGGASTGFPMLVAARTVQGCFGAMLAPSVLALLTTTFTDPVERNRAFAIYGGIAGAGGAIGLLLGGVLTSYASWRWTLYVNLVFAVVAITGALRLLARQRSTTRVSIDLPGTLTISGGLFALVYGFSHAESSSWTNGVTLGSFAASAVLLVAFFTIQARTAHPLLPLRVILDRNRGGSFIGVLIACIGMFGVFLFLTYYLQATRGYSPVATGLAFLPMVGCLSVVAAIATTKLLPRFGPRPLIPFGMLVSGAGLAYLTQIGLSSSYAADILPPLLVIGAGVGLIFAPAFNTATLGVAPNDAGVASALVNTTQQVGGSIGTSLLNTVELGAVSAWLVGHAGRHAPSSHLVAVATLHGYRVAFIWSAVIFGVGAVLTAVTLRTRGPVAVSAPAGAELPQPAFAG
ncbi:MAG TPA: MFS transporter [Acidimicrobiales bacterium]|nr:MFS transporter [Acidimicrobiales bacterium]